MYVNAARIPKLTNEPGSVFRLRIRRCVSSFEFGRFTGQAAAIGATGEYFAVIERNAVPVGGGFVTMAPGTHWYFQAWFADGALTSNFTDVVYLMFE